jgi:hypothetical protein
MSENEIKAFFSGMIIGALFVAAMFYFNAHLRWQ